MSLVCCSVVIPELGVDKNYNLLQSTGRVEFGEYLKRLAHPSNRLISYGIDAELRSLFSLYQKNWFTELGFSRFICLHREHKLLANRFPQLTYGTVIGNGKPVKRIYTPQKDVEEKGDSKKYINLENALFKFLNHHTPEHSIYKVRYRDMCIRQVPSELSNNIDGIMEYCHMDTAQLPALHKAMGETLVGRLSDIYTPEQIEHQQEMRGYYGAIVAEKTQNGYYIDGSAFMNFHNSRDRIHAVISTHINKTFPEEKTFKWNHKDKRWVFDRKAVENFLLRKADGRILQQFSRTVKTGALSIAKETFEKLYGGRKHDLDPKDYLQQVYRYLYITSSTRGLLPSVSKGGSKTANKFGDYFDRVEGVVRPFMNDYGAQTSRSQPRANGYLLLKPAWIRSLLIPPPAHCMVSADVSRQEVLFLAVLSQDTDLINACASGDPYVAFGLAAGILDEKDRGTDVWDMRRQACKKAVLSMQYGIGSNSLALQLMAIFKRNVSVGEAQKYISAFKSIYKAANQYREGVAAEYRRGKRLVLPDGWAMWGGNHNERSVKNFPVQGGCAVAMRYTDILCRNEGLHIPMTLHDGYYFYCPIDKGKGPRYEVIATLIRCMREGFRMALKNAAGWEHMDAELKIIGAELEHYPQYPHIEVDGKKYSMEYSKLYLDKRATNDLKLFGEFLRPSLTINQRRL